MSKKIVFRGFFFLLLLLVTISAHQVQSDLFDAIYTLGLDVPMTPFTTDMTLMLNQSNQEPYYKRDFYVLTKSTKGFKRLEARDLGWYEFKAPFQWTIGCLQHSDCPVK